jgi:hypothetical protein
LNQKVADVITHLGWETIVAEESLDCDADLVPEKQALKVINPKTY